MDRHSTRTNDSIAWTNSRRPAISNRHPVNTTTLDYLDDMSTSSGAPESWISSFCSLLGHEYFAEVSEEFIEDDFNLTGLQNQVAMYKEALESSSEMLYGLIHQRFICSRAGIQQMSEKYELGHFGCCPRTNCDQARTLPVGLSDIPGEDTVKLFCPSCLDVYVPPNSRFQTVDGAFFGRTFGALFLLTFPEYDLTKRGAEVLNSGGARINDDSTEMINGMYAKNIAPGLGAGRIYEPRIYGFRVSEVAKSGPRMQWLRDRPEDMTELDEARLYADEHPDSDEEDESMNGNGRPTPRRRAPRGNARLRAQRQAQNGSPMNVETNGAESEL
ncbi:casein kinase ii regulatory subunit [Colletotrichum higginsianum]|nr:casein kinase ii regulatory subunit [Colletotrichum higginsianum]